MIPCDGVVLAGGRSSRMGRSKSLMRIPGGLTLEQHAQQVLAQVCAGPVRVSRPHAQAPITADDLRDQTPQIGPLEGIRQALVHAQHALVAILAVDLPGVPSILYDRLYDVWRSEPQCDVVLAAPPVGPVQPLAALWHVRALSAIEQALERRVYRVGALLEALTWRSVVVDGAMLLNINTPEDWARFFGVNTP